MELGWRQVIEADLHCHTTASDGLLSPLELVKYAVQRGLKAIAITDHDTIMGWDEAERAGREYKIEILRGLELNTDWEGKEVHLLGYELDTHSTSLCDSLTNLQQNRRKRIFKILERLRDLGINIPIEDVLKYAHGESVGRPHVAQALIEYGFVLNTNEAFLNYLGQGAPAYVPRFKLDTKEGIQLIRNSHGVSVLAHPGISKLGEDIITAWSKIGLQGIEISHSDHSSEDEERYSKIAKKNGLLKTGGSDFHGDNKPFAQLGSKGVPMEIVWQIRKLTDPRL